ncbi:kinase-like protein [Nemania sp. FL0916]|nr:kinase-like protein [Nemania sp. FL0916]
MAAPDSNNNIARPNDIQEFTDLDGATGGREESPPNRVYTTFWKFYGDGEAYFAQIFKPRLDIEIDEVRGAMERVPDADIYPTVPEGVDLKVVMMDDDMRPSGEVYIKRPSLLTYEDRDDLGWVRDIFLGEAEIMDQVSSLNHKNIIRYHGCQVRDGRLAGIVLERHECSLYEFFLWGLDKNAVLDPQRFMAELESAISHLHLAGLAHNDLKPSNILLDKDRMPVLIDFGSCRPFGARLMQGGTPGWSNPERLVMASDKEHDLFGLEKIREWLGDPDRKMNG